MNEAEFSTNFSCETLREFLDYLAEKFDGGLDQDDIASFMAFIGSMNEDEEKKTSLTITYKKKAHRLRVKVFLDDGNSPDVYFYGPKGLISAINKAFEKYVGWDGQSHDCTMAFLSTLSFKEPKTIRKLLKAITKVSPEFVPQRFGKFEPLNQVFDAQNISRVAKDWNSMVFWENSNYGTAGCSSTEGRTYDDLYHARLSFDCSSKKLSMERLRALLEAFSKLLEVEFAYCFIATNPECKGDYYLAHYDQVYNMSLGVTTHNLRKGIPNLGWCTVFGPTYVKFFGKKRILSCPAYEVSEFHPGLICVQITKDLHSIKSNFNHFNISSLRKGRLKGVDSVVLDRIAMARFSIEKNSRGEPCGQKPRARKWEGSRSNSKSRITAMVAADGGSLEPGKVRRAHIRGVVDTEAAQLVLPGAVVTQLGLRKTDKIKVRYADGRRATRSWAEDAFIEILGRHGTFRAVVEPKRKEALIGAIVLEAFDLLPDCTHQCLVPRDPHFVISEIE